MRDVDAAELLHLRLAFFLLLQQLFLACYITAIELLCDVFAERCNGSSRDDLAADRSLDRNLELMARNLLGKLFAVIAIVGKNGAGKSTLVKLLARLYEPNSGQILMDDTNLNSVPRGELYDQIGFVFQSVGQYEASAADNLAFGNWPELLDKPHKVVALAERVGIHSLIEEMPQEYHTQLGRQFGEYNLSGGQRQQLAVARAFARDASMLILDEPTSNLDAESEYQLFSQFKELSQGRTTILISHRFSTVRMADRILVMEKGRIVESGTHETLMLSKGQYADLYNLHRRQFGSNELDGHADESYAN